jgi:septal ring factor EnvC (AmiA/AmiB activator)
MLVEKQNKVNVGIIITLATLLVTVTTYAVSLRSDASLCLQRITKVEANDKLQDDQINESMVVFAKINEQMATIQKDIAEIKIDLKEMR